MERYTAFLEKRKYLIIFVITIFTALFSISLKDIAYEGSYKIWFDRDSSILREYERFRTTFSGDDLFIVAFRDEEGIFREKPLQTVMELTQAFSTIDGVQKVDSITNYQFIKSVDDDLQIEDFITTLDDLQEKKAIALADPMAVHHLISEDATTTMLTLRLATNKGDDEVFHIGVMEQINTILDSTKSGYAFYITGAPAITASLVTISQNDAKILMPLAVMSVVGLLFLLFRNLLGVLIPSLTVVFTFLIVLGTQILLGYKLNNFTVNIPSFITAIAIADSIHLYLAWIYYRAKNETNYESVLLALKSNLAPIALTSFTTAAGFASLGVSVIEPVATFGIAITMGALIAFVLSVTLAPAILLACAKQTQVKTFSFLNFLDVRGYGAFIVRYDKKIVYGFVLVMLVFLYGLMFLKVDSNSINYFAKETQVREGNTFVEKNLGGSMVYEIVLDSKHNEGVKEPKFLEKIVVFEEELKKRYAAVRYTHSLKDIIVRMDQELSQSASSQLPQDKNLIAQYLLLYSMSLPQGVSMNDKLDTNERYLRLSVFLHLQDTSKDLEMIQWIQKWWDTNTIYTAEVQGQSALFASMQSSVSETLLVSMSMTLLIVSVFMLLLFKNLKMLWLLVLPNIAPVLLVGGVMGYANIPIDIGVAVSAAVILGIAVDDTIHFFSKYFHVRKSCGFEESIDYVLSHSGNAMVLSTFILSFTFLIFLWSDFIPNVNFAIVSVSALNLALVFDLVLLPALLSVFHNKEKI
jgi:predicted RND superfamily exporter protein